MTDAGGRGQYSVGADPDDHGENRYRMHRMESDIAEIKASVMSLQAGVSALQIGMGDAFVSRREYTERRTETDKRFEALETRGWGFVVGLLFAVLAALFALLRTIPSVAPMP